jgi:hypothetical protein
MSQQQLGAVALVALGILVAVGAGSAALRRLRKRQRSHEPLWSRLLVMLATVGLTVGFIATGVYYYAFDLAGTGGDRRLRCGCYWVRGYDNACSLAHGVGRLTRRVRVFAATPVILMVSLLARRLAESRS